MFRFAEPKYLYLLLLIPLVIAAFVLYRRSQKLRLKKFGDMELVSLLIPEASNKRVLYKFSLILTALTLAILALAQPQLGAKLQEVKREGVEVMLVVDVSRSMLAEDLKPNRLEATKFAVNRMVETLDKDRVGMVVFAGEAYVQLPITADFVSAKSFINSLSTEMVPIQGTTLSRGIELATQSFTEQSHKSRAIILISDGESHDDDPIAAAQLAKDKGIIIYTIGIGTTEGSPLFIDGEMIKDEDEQIVVSKLDEERLQQIAVLTGGTYIRATNQNIGLEKIVKRIRQMETQEFSSLAFAEYNDQFHYVVVIVFILLMVEFSMIDRKNRILRKISIFK